MKRFIALLAAFSMLAPTLAAADGYDRHGKRWGPPGHTKHYDGGRYDRYYPARDYYRYDRYYRGHKHKDSDDAAWAIGGLVLGTIIGSAAARRSGPAYQESQPLPPPQKRKVVTCYDEVAYDENGDPYVDRQCYENWR
jgi:hypothetical protein